MKIYKFNEWLNENANNDKLIRAFSEKIGSERNTLADDIEAIKSQLEGEELATWMSGAKAITKELEAVPTEILSLGEINDEENEGNFDDLEFGEEIWNDDLHSNSPGSNQIYSGTWQNNKVCIWTSPNEGEFIYSVKH